MFVISTWSYMHEILSSEHFSTNFWKFVNFQNICYINIWRIMSIVYQNSCESIYFISKAYHKWNIKNIIIPFSQNSFNLMEAFKQLQFIGNYFCALRFHVKNKWNFSNLAIGFYTSKKTVLHIRKACMDINSTLKSNYEDNFMNQFGLLQCFLEVFNILNIS